MEALKPGAQCRLTWIGHATVALELGGVRLLTDPVLGQRVFVLRRLAEPVGAIDDPDVVLVSHAHHDHLDLQSLQQLGGAPEILAPSVVADWLRKKGTTRVRTAHTRSVMHVGGVEIEAVHALHDGRRWPRGEDADALGFVISGAGLTVYFAGDTDLYPEMAALKGRVDVALLPVWGWGPTLGPGHMDPQRAAEAAAAVAPRVAIPIHWGTIGLPWVRPSPEELRAPAEAFAAAAERLAPDVEVRILDPGESTTVEPGAHAPGPGMI